MKIAIGSDKSGFPLKESVKKFLVDTGIDFDDLGTVDLENGIPYYKVAARVAPLVQRGEYTRAVLFCGTGAGMAVIANKHKGVIAVCAESVYGAKMARAINNASVLSLGGWVLGAEMAVEIVKTFLNTEFLEGLEDFRKVFLTNAVQEICKFEEEVYG